MFDHLYKRGIVIEVGRRAQTRRFWFKALDADPERARKALAFIGALFHVECAQAAASPELRLSARRARSTSIVDGSA